MPYEDLAGKVALVTGAGKRSGIGFAVARKLASCGAHVVLADLGRISLPGSPVRTASLEEMHDLAADLASAFGIEAFPVEVDVTDDAKVLSMAEAVDARFGRLDILCNNAGASFGVPSPVHTYDPPAWYRTIDVNLHGVFRVSRAVVPLLLGRPGASIVNIASRAGKVPPLFNGAYAVAKAGVIMLTKVMAKELAGQGIRVNAVCPGQIGTDLEQWRFELEAQFLGTTVEERKKEMVATIPLGRIGDPQEVANLVAFLASAESSYLTGQAINVTGGQLMEL
jgi:NAD(P)-dependent dehydrogenase (short-subunit alcohol dehydrogenase family)